MAQGQDTCCSIQAGPVDNNDDNSCWRQIHRGTCDVFGREHPAFT